MSSCTVSILSILWLHDLPILRTYHTQADLGGISLLSLITVGSHCEHLHQAISHSSLMYCGTKDAFHLKGILVLD